MKFYYNQQRLTLVRKYLGFLIWTSYAFLSLSVGTIFFSLINLVYYFPTMINYSESTLLAFGSLIGIMSFCMVLMCVYALGKSRDFWKELWGEYMKLYPWSFSYQPIIKGKEKSIRDIVRGG